MAFSSVLSRRTTTTSLVLVLFVFLFSQQAFVLEAFSTTTTTTRTTTTTTTTGGLAVQYHTVVLSSTGQLELVAGKDSDRGLAWGYYLDEVNTTGWGSLVVISNPKRSNEEQAKAAGFLEGALTWERIYQSKLNQFVYMFNGTTAQAIPPAARRWMMANYASLLARTSRLKTNSPYWEHVYLTLVQLQYMSVGYNAFAEPDKKLHFMDLYILNMGSDLGDVISAFSAATGTEPTFSPNYESQRCSGLVKVLDDFSDIFVAHTTWGGYATMLRIFKYYELNFSGKNLNTQVLFSSYPALLNSDDDFYTLNPSRLVVFETTLSVINPEIWKFVISGENSSVPTWIRCIVANRLAQSGQDWISTFVMFNSGTYNNQWVIVDLKLFEPGKQLQQRLIWIVEQMPGYTEGADVTPILQYGYWPSYNRPYFRQLYEDMGYAQYTRQYGNQFSYELSPRAKIFRREQGKVKSFDDFKNLMLYNHYQTDPFSEGYAGYAIAARFDLEKRAPPLPTNWFEPGLHGGIDSKATSFTLMNKMMMMNSTGGIQGMACEAISGPTHVSQPPFKWSTSRFEALHLGMPDEFNFNWKRFQAP